MAKDSPFFLSRVECPVCKTLNEFETIKVGAYVESGRDTDFCPTGIKWRYPRYEDYNPLVFFSATCSNCYYTREFNSSYKEWKSDNHFRTYRLKPIKSKHLDQLAQADSVIKQLGKGIDVARYPNESAIIKMHLAILDEMFSDRQNDLDLGRWYLRIAWIFRDFDSSDNPNRSFLRGLMVELDGKSDQLTGAIENIKQQSAVLKRHLMAHFETDKISAELKSQMFPYREKFSEKIVEFDESVDSCTKRLQVFNSLMEEYKSVTLGVDSAGNENSYGDYSAFTDFLSTARKKWDGIAVTEQQAIEKAVYHYREAFVDSRNIAPGNQQIQASYLIAELSRRIGQLDQAREYFTSTVKHGQEFIYRHSDNKSQTALARKILELAIEQNRLLKEQYEAAK